jgi:hypothetical protein
MASRDEMEHARVRHQPANLKFAKNGRNRSINTNSFSDITQPCVPER